MPQLPGATPVLALLASMVEEQTGIHYGLAELEVLRDKATLRANEAGFESLLDYYYFLRYDAAGAAEMDALTDSLVVGETYFFRELAPLAFLVDRLVAPRAARGERPRIWSAACASGEEPLTLAMLLDDRGLLDRVELVATDISGRALKRAAAARYGPRALRDTAVPALVERYLRRAEDGTIQAARHLVEAIRYRRLNLTDGVAVRTLAPVDYVVCRNVLIYFSDETAARVVANIASALAPGGVLFVGVSESLLRLATPLHCEEHDEVFLYRKPA